MPSDNMSRPTSDAYREGWERTFGKTAVSIVSDNNGDLVVSARGETYTIPRKDAEAMAAEELEAQRESLLRVMSRGCQNLPDPQGWGGERREP